MEASSTNARTSDALRCSRLAIALVLHIKGSSNDDTSLFKRIRCIWTPLTSTMRRSGPEKETALATLGLLGTTIADEEILKNISSQLVYSIAEPDNWLRSLAQTTVSQSTLAPALFDKAHLSGSFLRS